MAALKLLAPESLKNKAGSPMLSSHATLLHPLRLSIALGEGEWRTVEF